MARILAVDDSPSIRSLLSAMLGGEGHTVVLANDGADAMALVGSQKFDLVITDFNMPRLNGLEFIKGFRSSNRFTPVLVLTTEINPQLKEAAKAAGATGWVVKPFKIQGFKDLVTRLLA